jgi:hypothetical protein
MKSKLLVLIILTTTKIAFSSCDGIKPKEFFADKQGEIISFILLNYHHLVSDVENKSGEYLSSLLSELEIKNNDAAIKKIQELKAKSTSEYEFAKSIINFFIKQSCCTDF